MHEVDDSPWLLAPPSGSIALLGRPEVVRKPLPLLVREKPDSAMFSKVVLPVECARVAGCASVGCLLGCEFEMCMLCIPGCSMTSCKHDN